MMRKYFIIIVMLSQCSLTVFAEWNSVNQFSDVQGQDNWRYYGRHWRASEWSPAIWDSVGMKWRYTDQGVTVWLDAQRQTKNEGNAMLSMREWTAPVAAEVYISSQFKGKNAVYDVCYYDASRDSETKIYHGVTDYDKPDVEFEKKIQIVQTVNAGDKIRFVIANTGISDGGSEPVIFTVKINAESNSTDKTKIRPLNITTTGYTLDDLPMVPNDVQVLQFASRNKTGKNLDAGYFLYNDENGDPVLFDVIGPGCIKSIWSTNIVEGGKLLKFYFDDESSPRITIDAYEMYNGKNALFPAPLSSYSKVGQFEGIVPYAGNCFVPIPFKKRLKITVDKESNYQDFFYHFIYETYTPGSCKETINYVDKSGKLNPKAEPPSALFSAFKNTGKDVKEDKGSKILTAKVPGVFQTGDPAIGVTAMEYEGQGSIRRLTLDLPADKDIINKLYMYICFDGSEYFQVIAPINLLIANAVHPQEVNSLPIAVEAAKDGRMKAHIYFPMPFWQSFKIGFGNDQIYGDLGDSLDKAGGINLEAAISEKVYPHHDAGYFTTYCQQGQTTYGVDWIFARAFGKGVFLGAVQSMQYQAYCEGDERFYIDGSGSPAFNGTGSEDYYLCCYWPNYNFNLPFAGCVGNIKTEAGKEGKLFTIPTCYYRFHLDAPIPFHSGIDARIEHGGDSVIHSNYRSVGFYYLNANGSLLQTDMVDIGNSNSEKMHAYVSDSPKISSLKSQYEGTDDQANVFDTGRYHKNADVKFTVAILPSNKGVRLRRRLDQMEQRNMVDVYVDDWLVGRWYQADQNPHKRWCDLDFNIAEQYTADKDAITIKLKSVSDQSVGDFSDFRYWVYSKQ